MAYGGRRLTDRNHRLKYGPMFGIIKKTWGFIPKAFRESVRILAFVIWAVQGSKHVIFAVKVGQGAGVQSTAERNGAATQRDMLWQQVQGQNNIKGEKQHGKREAGLCGEEGAFCG